MAQKHKTHDVERIGVVQRQPTQSMHAQSERGHVSPPANVLQRTAGIPTAALRPPDILALQRTVGNRAVQRMLVQRVEEEDPRRRGTGLPDNLKSGVESLSGMAMDGVKVHYDSALSTEFGRQAFTQGNEIHLGRPYEEDLIPHEGWHRARREMGRIKPTMQLKLAVGPANDHYEREADRVASSVMSDSAAPKIQRQASEEEDQTIQTKSIASTITPLIQRQETPEEEQDNPAQLKSDGGSPSVQPGVEQGIERARGGGQPLPDALLARMERSFGADFSAVRVHSDSESDSLNRSLHARAFTTGHDLFFRRGEYNPDSPRGQELIAHELTHVVQQNGGKSGKKDLSLKRVIQRDWLDEERGFFNSDPTGFYGNIPGKVGKEARRENYNRDDKRDLANYGLLGLGATSAVAKAATDRGPILFTRPASFFDEAVPLASTTGQALSYMGAISAGAGTATALVDSYRGFREMGSGRSAEQENIGFLTGVSGLASATQQSATTAFHAGNIVANPAMAATAQTVAGGAGIAMGAVDVIRGIYAHSKAKENIERLQNLKRHQDQNVRALAHQAQTTQKMRQSTAKWTVAKGVFTAVGGGLLLGAAALSPVGWALIGAGAILGAYGALRKYLDKKERAKNIAMNELGVRQPQLDWERRLAEVEKKTRWGTDKRKAELADLGPSPLDQTLKAHKFISVGHFYANFIHRTANDIYDVGVRNRAPLELQARERILTSRNTLFAKEAYLKLLPGMSTDDMKRWLGVEIPQGNRYLVIEELLAGMGLKFDFRKKPPEPKPEKIGKALHD